MLDKKIEKLKRFIEIADQEVFVGAACPVYVKHRRYTKSTLAAYWKRRVTIWDFFWLTLFNLKLLIATYCFSIISFIFCIGTKDALAERRDWLARRLQQWGFFADHMHTWRAEWYTLTRDPTIMLCDDWKLAEYAWHEVRHRIQFRFGYQASSFDESDVVHSLFNDFHGEIRDEMKGDGFYTPEQIPTEIDARVLGFVMILFMKAEFSDRAEVTEEMFRMVTKKYKAIFLSKTPTLE